MIKRIYFDTNVFITAFEIEGAIAGPAWRLLELADRGELQGVTSELTLAELLSKPPENNVALASRYEDIITDRPKLQVVGVNRGVLLQAARIRRLSPATKLPDAIHLATAALTGCSHIVSDDQRLRPVPGLTLVRLGPQTMHDIQRSHP